MSVTALIQQENRFTVYRDLLAEITRFITVGGVNTFLTFLLYQLLVTYLNPQWSYAIAWLSGFVFVSIAYPKYVFRSGKSSPKQLFLLLLLYVSSFLLGLFLMDLSVVLGMHKRISVIAVIIVTSIMNYIFTKFLFGRKIGQSG